MEEQLLSTCIKWPLQSQKWVCQQEKEKTMVLSRSTCPLLCTWSTCPFSALIVFKRGLWVDLLHSCVSPKHIGSTALNRRVYNPTPCPGAQFFFACLLISIAVSCVCAHRMHSCRKGFPLAAPVKSAVEPPGVAPS